ncbi:hypothetical protein BJL90_07305 [Clostridium formicaceticum]|nr:hypothetical protein BJL90_07305 [Clostridium formicaceticum]
METMPWKVVIFNAMPEAMLLIYLGLTLIGIKPDKKRVFIAGVFQGVICYYVRKNFDFGIHILLQYLSFVILVWLFTKAPLIASFIASIIGIIIAILLESFIGISIPYLTGITILEIMSRDWIRIFICLPYLGTLILIAYLIDKYEFTLEQEIKILKKIK